MSDNVIGKKETLERMKSSLMNFKSKMCQYCDQMENIATRSKSSFKDDKSQAACKKIISKANEIREILGIIEKVNERIKDMIDDIEKANNVNINE